MSPQYRDFKVDAIVAEWQKTILSYDDALKRGIHAPSENDLEQLDTVMDSIDGYAEYVWSERQCVRARQGDLRTRLKRLERPNIALKAARAISKRLGALSDEEIADRIAVVRDALADASSYRTALDEDLETLYSCRERCEKIRKAYAQALPEEP